MAGQHDYCWLRLFVNMTSFVKFRRKDVKTKQKWEFVPLQQVRFVFWLKARIELRVNCGQKGLTER